MTLLLPIFYLFVLSFLVYRTEFFKICGFSGKAITSLALIKMLAGIAYIFAHTQWINSGDIALYFRDSQIILEQIHTDWKIFFRLVFGPNKTEILPHLAEAIYKMGFWGDTAAYTVVRFNAVFSLFSMGNIYVHGIFSGFLSFIGCILIAKCFENALKNIALSSLSVFLFPSVLFWTSGMHKEFVSTFALGLICFGFFKLFESIRLKYVFLLLIGYTILFLVREHIASLLIPCFIAFAITRKTNVRPVAVYGMVYLIIAAVFILIPIPFAGGTITELILNKKDLFNSLKTGNTHLELGQYSSLSDIIIHIPQALFNTTFRPLITEANTPLLTIASFESMVFGIMLIFSLSILIQLPSESKPFLLFFLFFGISYLIVTGLIVPNTGAILRYRSIALIALIPAIFHILSVKINFFNQIDAKWHKMLKNF
jgi:hypothetical protein